MGAWAEGSFDNDDAADWVWELAEADTSILEEAFSRVAECEDYLEATDCVVAIAAAELPGEVSAFVTRIGTPPSPELVSSALSALKRIKTRSELQESWAEWHQAIAELESRLA